MLHYMLILYCLAKAFVVWRAPERGKKYQFRKVYELNFQIPVIPLQNDGLKSKNVFVKRKPH